MVLSSTTQSIIQDFASTKLSSYQIAYKYSLPQKTAESILRKNLTDNFFENKEKLAVKLLKDSIQDLLSQNCSKQKIAEKVGISRSTCYRLIEKIENELDDDLVQIVSIENRTVASDNNGSSEKELPELALSNTDMCNHQSSCSSATYPVAESSSEESDASSLNKAYQKYPPRKYYHRRDWGRDTRRQEQQWSTINLKGIRINFDLTICSSDLINKLITVIKENS